MKTISQDNIRKMSAELVPQYSENGWTLGGKTIQVDDPLCLAKFENNVYFIKRVVFGALAGHFVNPMQLNKFDKEEMTIRLEGRHKYTFEKVQKDVFDFYLKFLKTRNQAWLRQAERTI